MSPVTSALIDYWHRLPAETAPARRRRLRAAIADVRAGRSEPSVLVTYALGDTDEEIVAAATTAYIEIHPAAVSRRAALDDACEWIRRGLTLNRGGVFAAVLRAGDDVALASLANQRLVLSSADVESICRSLGRSVLPRRVRRFLDDWLNLLGDGDDPERPGKRDLLLRITASQAVSDTAVA